MEKRNEKDTIFIYRCIFGGNALGNRMRGSTGGTGGYKRGHFEKVGSLGTSLPTNDERITTEPGDIILYQGNQITIYYDTNTYSFTRLGRVNGLSQSELKAILGSGGVTAVFSIASDTEPEIPA